MATRWSVRRLQILVVAALLAIYVLHLLVNGWAFSVLFSCRSEGEGDKSEGEGPSFAWNLNESRNFNASGRTLMKQGIIFVTYGMDEEMLRRYTELAVVSAHSYKKRNPSLHISLITSAKNVTPSEDSVDLVIPIPSDLNFGARQWTTRILVLILSPYAITLIADSDTFCCGSLAPLFDEFEARGFDFAVVNHGLALNYLPDNGVIMFRKSSGFMYLVNSWVYHQMIVGWDKGDQYTLHCAMLSTFNNRMAKLAYILPQGGVRWIPAVGEPWGWGSERQHHHTLLLTETVLMTHSLGNNELGDHICDVINRDAPRPRAFVYDQTADPWPTTPERINSAYQVAFDQESLNIKLNATCHELPWASASTNFFEEILSMKPYKKRRMA